jgi:hypothetical protein
MVGNTLVSPGGTGSCRKPGLLYTPEKIRIHSQASQPEPTHDRDGNDGLAFTNESAFHF